jgi:hypothetical protein
LKECKWQFHNHPKSLYKELLKLLRKNRMERL